MGFMDTYRCIRTKLDIREFSRRKVPAGVKLKVLEAARLTGTGNNNQRWRFILAQRRDGLRQLAKDSATRKWVANADFAVIVCTDSTYGRQWQQGSFHHIDAGRSAQDMQLAAWNYRVLSCVFTGIDIDRLREDFDIPMKMNPTIGVGFGYPPEKITGRRKNRKRISEIVFSEKYHRRFEPQRLDRYV
jgi:nitroreductase